MASGHVGYTMFEPGVRTVDAYIKVRSGEKVPAGTFVGHRLDSGKIVSGHSGETTVAADPRALFLPKLSSTGGMPEYMGAGSDLYNTGDGDTELNRIPLYGVTVNTIYNTKEKLGAKSYDRENRFTDTLASDGTTPKDLYVRVMVDLLGTKDHYVVNQPSADASEIHPWEYDTVASLDAAGLETGYIICYDRAAGALEAVTAGSSSNSLYDALVPVGVVLGHPRTLSTGFAIRGKVNYNASSSEQNGPFGTLYSGVGKLNRPFNNGVVVRFVGGHEMTLPTGV